MLALSTYSTVTLIRSEIIQEVSLCTYMRGSLLRWIIFLCGYFLVINPLSESHFQLELYLYVSAVR